MAEKLHEKCAVTAVSLESGSSDAAALAYEALFAMQHRGTEATGIAAWGDEGTDLISGEGMVKDVYHDAAMRHLLGSAAVGHNRYATFGPKQTGAQPIVDGPTGTALGHNGNLPNPIKLEHYLDKRRIGIRGRTDSEMAGMTLASFVRDGYDIAEATKRTYPLIEGAATCVAMQDGTVVAFKDPHGIRPGVIGKLDNGYMVASESCGLDIAGAEFVRDIRPGEMVIMNGDKLESQQLAEPDEKFDVFEIVYFMRPDSLVKGESVYAKRYRAGQELAQLHPPITDNLDNVLVVPVPDTSIPAAEGYAKTLKLEHANAIAKNRYIGRTFMQNGPAARRIAHRRKHNFIADVIRDRDLVLVDDSIVRLNTHPALTEEAYAKGARSVSIVIASPPVLFPNYQGIDTPAQKELAAAQLSVAEIQRRTGAKYLGYLTLSGLVRSTGMPADILDLSCFTGDYPIDIGRWRDEIKTPVSTDYLD